MTSTIQRTATPREIIVGLVGAVDGELSSRSRVVDGLLDLRNVSPDAAFTARVDELLAGIPGITTVPNTWWLDRLAELAELPG
jgi:hypothetical protein